MNWPLNVKGAKALDLMADGIEPAKLAEILKAANQAVKITYDVLNYHKLLRTTPVDDPRNVIDCALAIQWHADYVKAFFESAQLDKAEQVMIVEVPVYQVLARVLSTVAFTFTYDPEITWK